MTKKIAMVICLGVLAAYIMGSIAWGQPNRQELAEITLDGIVTEHDVAACVSVSAGAPTTRKCLITFAAAGEALARHWIARDPALDLKARQQKLNAEPYINCDWPECPVSIHGAYALNYCDTGMCTTSCAYDTCSFPIVRPPTVAPQESPHLGWGDGITHGSPKGIPQTNPSATLSCPSFSTVKNFFLPNGLRVVELQDFEYTSLRNKRRELRDMERGIAHSHGVALYSKMDCLNVQRGGTKEELDELGIDIELNQDCKPDSYPEKRDVFEFRGHEMFVNTPKVSE